MKKIKQMGAITLIVILIVVLGLLIVSRRPPEPAWRGKSLTVWLSRLRSAEWKVIRQTGTNANSSGEREQAAGAVHEMGTNTIPTLLRKLQAKDASLTKSLVRLWQRQSLIQFPFETA